MGNLDIFTYLIVQIVFVLSADFELSYCRTKMIWNMIITSTTDIGSGCIVTLYTATHELTSFEALGLTGLLYFQFGERKG
jgi:hypothetical protein